MLWSVRTQCFASLDILTLPSQAAISIRIANSVIRQDRCANGNVIILKTEGRLSAIKKILDSGPAATLETSSEVLVGPSGRLHDAVERQIYERNKLAQSSS